MTKTAISSGRTALVIGASRGLGHAMVRELLDKGWRVMGTVRGTARTPLHDLADAYAGRVEIETLDICEPEQLAALDRRLADRTFDLLFVNAGTTNRDPSQPIGDVSTDEFMHVMLTNALSPMRVVETLQRRVPPTGIIGVMSSGQGSVANNENGDRELYRGSKAALNTFMRSFAARHRASPRAMVLMAPGWVQTELGGAGAKLTIEESVPNLVNTLLGKQGTAGLQYVDYLDRTVPW